MFKCMKVLFEKTIEIYDKKIVNINLFYISILLIIVAVIIFKKLWRKPNIFK